MKKFAAGLFASSLLLTAVPAVPVQAAEKTAAQTLMSVSDDCMQKVFKNLTADGSTYSAKKKLYQESGFTCTETLKDGKITFTVKGTDTNSTFTYAMDGDYIVSTWKEEDYLAISFLGCMQDALADVLGMEKDLTEGLNAGIFKGYSSKDCVKYSLANFSFS